METKNRYKKMGMIGTALAGLALIVSMGGCGNLNRTIKGATRAPEVFNQLVQSESYRSDTKNIGYMKLESRPDLYEKYKEKGMLEDFGNESGRVLKQIKNYN